MIVNFVMNDELRSQSVSELDLSNRSMNALKREDIKTVGQIVDRWYKFDGVRGLGKGCKNEIRNSVINAAICQMSKDELLEFWYRLILDNDKEALLPIVKNYDLFVKTSKD